MKKRKSKTPAQDRLQNVADKKKTAVIDSIKAVKSTSLKSTLRKSANNAPIAKKALFVAKSKRDEIDSANPPLNEAENVANAAEIPALFPSKAPAQERLKSLQNKLSMNESRCDHDAARVFGDTFGIASANPATTLCDDDEAMDWEPCQDSNYTFQELESMVVDVLTDSAYIIPDTNVFIDSLASIKAIIEKG